MDNERLISAKNLIARDASDEQAAAINEVFQHIEAERAARYKAFQGVLAALAALDGAAKDQQAGG